MNHFVYVDRNTPMLLSPDLRDWVPDDDLVHFVIEVIETMHLSFHINRRGCGSRQYPPKMMLALLVYCYCNSIFSSRRIERSTYRDVAVRYLTGDTHPDHDTICKFRRENFDAVNEAILQVLQLARQLGILKVGTVSVDGTHLRANASKDRNVRYDRACELEDQLREDVTALMQQAEEADDHDDQDGQSLPAEISRRERLRERMREAREQLESEAKKRAHAERLAQEKKRKEREKQPNRRKMRVLQEPDDTPRDRDQTNLTDADSRLMRKSRREGYTQSYNAQAAVDADGSMLIVGGYVTNQANDANELPRAIASVDESLGEVKRVLADTGYSKADVFDELDSSGIDAFVAVSRNENHEQRRYDYRPERVRKKKGQVIKDSRLLAMREKLRTDAGREIYAKRKQTVEPVFGIIKQVMGFRQFLLRGLDKVNGEWSLLRLAYNMKRMQKLISAI